jgi:DNA invertase Pin-like site-specific DNA recombinase
MRKAYAYVRVSGKSQVKGDGFLRQEKAIAEYAKAHGVRIIKVFREKGVSGGLLDRPAFSDLMRALHGDGAREVLIERIDRLARDLMVQETIIADLKRHAFTLISVTEPDLLEDDPSRKAFRQIMGVFAEYEKSMLVLKLRAARERAGRYGGRKAYGADPSEHRALQRMRRLRAEGKGYDTVAAALNEEGLTARGGGAWFAASVRRILIRET